MNQGIKGMTIIQKTYMSCYSALVSYERKQRMPVNNVNASTIAHL